MTITLNPYLQFRGAAREALDFYASVLGGTPEYTTFAEGGLGEQFPGEGDLVMHGRLDTTEGLVLMAADAAAAMPLTNGHSVSISLFGDDEETLTAYWNGLSKGATITMPFEVASWGDRFGGFTDRFGIDWWINVTLAPVE